MVCYFPTLFLASPSGKNQTVLRFQRAPEPTASPTDGLASTKAAALLLPELFTSSCNQTHISGSTTPGIKAFLKNHIYLKYTT